jgi:hypothetical protein
MNVWEFEQKVWDVDHLRVIVRAPTDAVVQAFDWVKKANQNLGLTEYINLRINSRIAPLAATVIAGNGQMPHGLTHIGNIRDSYSS